MKKSSENFDINSSLRNIINSSPLDSIIRLNLALANSRLDLMTEDTEHPGDGDCFFYSIAIVNNFNTSESRFLGKSDFDKLLAETKNLKDILLKFLRENSVELKSFKDNIYNGYVRAANDPESRSAKSQATRGTNNKIDEMISRLSINYSKKKNYPYIDNTSYYQELLYIVFDIKVIIYVMSQDQTKIEYIVGGDFQTDCKSTINILLTNSTSAVECHYLPLFPTRKL